MTNKKETERMLFLADYFVNGNVPDNSAILREEILKNFGKDYVGEKEVPDPGFFSAVKRTFGWGGSHTERVQLEDKMGEMSDDDLRAYLDEVYKNGVEGSGGVSTGGRHAPDFLAFGRKALDALDRFDHYVHDYKHSELYSTREEPEKAFRPSAKSQLELWEAVQKFTQTEFAKLHSEDDLGVVLKKSVIEDGEVPSPLSDFFKLAKGRTGDHNVYWGDERLSEIIGSLVENIRESDGPTLNAITNYLKDNNKHEVFSKQRAENFGEYLMDAYADEAKKNRETGLRSRTMESRLRRGSSEGENYEKNETKMLHKLPRSTEGKRPMLPDPRDGR